MGSSQSGKAKQMQKCKKCHKESPIKQLYLICKDCPVHQQCQLDYFSSSIMQENAHLLTCYGCSRKLPTQLLRKQDPEFANPLLKKLFDKQLSMCIIYCKEVRRLPYLKQFQEVLRSYQLCDIVVSGYKHYTALEPVEAISGRLKSKILVESAIIGDPMQIRLIQQSQQRQLSGQSQVMFSTGGYTGKEEESIDKEAYLYEYEETPQN